MFHEHLLEKPLTWKKSRMIFVNSMSDTFHEDITDEQNSEALFGNESCALAYFPGQYQKVGKVAAIIQDN